MKRTPEHVLDVLLVSDDAELRRLALARRTAGASLQCLSTKEVTDELVDQAGQVWVDLDHAVGTFAPSRGRRVYFHSRPVPSSATLPAGVFIRKPCGPTVFDVLWADVPVTGECGPRPAAPAARQPLPGWLLDLHELNLKAFCHACATILPQRLGYGTVSLYLHDSARGLLTLAETTHTRPVDLIVRTDKVGENLMAAVARTGCLLRTDRVSRELARYGIQGGEQRPHGDESCLVAPLVSGGRLWGVLNFSGCARSDQTELGLPLEEIVRFLSRCLRHACEYHQARTEARVDSLTGLYNQRWIMEALEREIRRAQRFNSALAVLMIDLDGLKAINDQHGHAAGDCLLRHVAGRIGAVLRQFDGAGRVGGDEFVIILPATSLKGARQVARRLLRSIREDAAQYGDHSLPITVSIGVAEWRTGWEARQLIDGADQAMYHAKNEGRDRLGMATESEERPSATDGLNDRGTLDVLPAAQSPASRSDLRLPSNDVQPRGSEPARP